MEEQLKLSAGAGRDTVLAFCAVPGLVLAYFFGLPFRIAGPAGEQAISGWVSPEWLPPGGVIAWSALLLVLVMVGELWFGLPDVLLMNTFDDPHTQKCYLHWLHGKIIDHSKNGPLRLLSMLCFLLGAAAQYDDVSIRFSPILGVINTIWCVKWGRPETLTIHWVIAVGCYCFFIACFELGTSTLDVGMLAPLFTSATFMMPSRVTVCVLGLITAKQIYHQSVHVCTAALVFFMCARILQLKNTSLVSQFRFESQAETRASEFLSSVSHEMRTPLHVLGVNVDEALRVAVALSAKAQALASASGCDASPSTAQSNAAVADILAALQAAQQSSQAAARMTEDVLTFAALRVHKLALVNGPFCVQVRALVRASARPCACRCAPLCVQGARARASLAALALGRPPGPAARRRESRSSLTH